MKSDSISHYRIIKKIGEGGMGEVYLAEDMSLRRKVALKVLQEKFTRDSEMLRRFEQEARSISALNHPNIVTIHEVGEEDACHFIVTEFIEGETLRQLIDNKGLSVNEVLDIVIQVTAALSAAHQAGVIHRDIKPENIMVRPDGFVKVLDFGLAKLVRIEVALESTTVVNNETKPGTVLGTPSYMSPEQLKMIKADQRADIWSLGVVLYEMITGLKPFWGSTIVDWILNKEPYPLAFLRKDAPIELQRIIDKALRKDREQRYQTGHELLVDLKVLKDRPESEAKTRQIEGYSENVQSAISEAKTIFVQEKSLAPPDLTGIADKQLVEGHILSPSVMTFRPSPVPLPPRIGFVSRYDEQGRNIVARVKDELLCQKRIVTLWGPGGVGKTTLASEVARGLKEAFADQVIWISANGRAAFSLLTMLDEVAAMFGRSDLHQLAIEFKKKEVQSLFATSPFLIVLDNFETITPRNQVSCINFLESLESCSTLITTREKIVQAYNIRLLNMSKEEARQLTEQFVREEAHDPQVFSEIDYEMIIEASETNPQVLQWILAQVDLAQEPDVVLEELKRGEGDAADRVFDRSFNLRQLGNDGRNVLLALSLFVPSASRAALAEVAGMGKNVIRLNKKILPKLALLWLVKTTDANQRLKLEGLTRELAKARLSKDKRLNEFRRRFITFFTQYAQSQTHDFSSMERERDNIIAAMEMAFEHKDWKRVARIWTNVDYLFHQGGYWHQALPYAEKAIQVATNLRDNSLIGRFKRRLGDYHAHIGNWDEAVQLLDESISIFKAIGDHREIARVLHHYGFIAQERGDYNEARRLYIESLEVKKQLKGDLSKADTLHQLGILEDKEGNQEEAIKLFNESIEIRRKAGRGNQIGAGLHQLAIIEEKRDNLQEAKRLYEEALRLDKITGNQPFVLNHLYHLGHLNEKLGDFTEAEKWYKAALELSLKIGESEDRTAYLVKRLEETASRLKKP